MIALLILLLCGASTAFIVQFVLYRKEKRNSVRKETDLADCRKRIIAMTQEYDFMAKHYQESELLARLVRQSPNAIMLMDSDGNIQSINRGFVDMYEYSFKEFTSALGSNYRQTSFSPDVQRRIDFIFDTKKPFRYEALNVTKTGKQLWTQTALVPILDDAGNVANMATIDTDIDQRVTQSDKLISEMEQLNERIDQLSNEFKFLEDEFRNLFQNINELYQLIELTDQILGFIKEISSETRILGFNASIEANRAGDQGVGFRVITNKIIDISKNTIQSIAEINDILRSIKTKQDELIAKKEDSANRMASYIDIIDFLKKEVQNIESSIAEFKSLA